MKEIEQQPEQASRPLDTDCQGPDAQNADQIDNLDPEKVKVAPKIGI